MMHNLIPIPAEHTLYINSIDALHAAETKGNIRVGTLMIKRALLLPPKQFQNSLIFNI